MNTNLKYLSLLAEKFPNQHEVSKEIVLLTSTLNLTKGAEIFLSDVHGEDEAFQHVLRNGSGVIKQKIEELFPTISTKEKKQLASLIYYPEEKLALLKKEIPDLTAFYKQTLARIILITRDFSAIYANRKLQRLVPKSYGDIILELVAERTVGDNNQYYEDIIDNVIDIGQADKLIIEFSYFIQRLCIHKIHIIGDVYDRGPGAETILDELMNHHAVDFQWGNHDIVWMGAAWGSEACLANVIRVSLRYGNTETLERGYGINLLPLASFALEHYKDDNSIIFNPKVSPGELLNNSEQWLSSLMHKAISIIQFKLESQLIQRRPEYQMNDRLIIDKIDLEQGKVQIEGQTYELTDTFLPTLDPNSPFELSEEEAAVVDKLKESFLKSQRLQHHARFLLEQGGMYKVTNKNLLYHGCIPLDKNGHLKEVSFGAAKFKGKALMDYLEKEVQVAYSGVDGSDEKQKALDMTWYLWAGPDSPIFGKHKMATFERYFVSNKAIQKEKKGYYYQFRNDPEACKRILQEFGLEQDQAVILNGHVPVSVVKGESPIKANGRLIVIDGGFCKAYQGQTGIAGYTLIHNHFGRQLIAHETFESQKKAIEEELDIAYSEVVLSQSTRKLRVRDLDDGKVIFEKIEDLKALLALYQSGELKEKVLNQ